MVKDYLRYAFAPEIATDAFIDTYIGGPEALREHKAVNITIGPDP
jgi:hypothetical protein